MWREGGGFAQNTKEQRGNEIPHLTFLRKLQITIYVDGSSWKYAVHGLPTLPLLDSSPKIPLLLALISCPLPF